MFRLFEGTKFCREFTIMRSREILIYWSSRSLVGNFSNYRSILANRNFTIVNNESIASISNRERYNSRNRIVGLPIRFYPDRRIVDLKIIKVDCAIITTSLRIFRDAHRCFLEDYLPSYSY